MIEKVGAVILNYCSPEDSRLVLLDLLGQDYPELEIFLVDNDSPDKSGQKLWDEIREGSMGETTVRNEPGAIEVRLSPAEGSSALARQIVFIPNGSNRGYSAGNNAGIRRAIESGCTAILVVNPDVSLPDKSTISRLVNCLFADEKALLIGPRITNTKGEEENPLKEPRFWQEAFANFFLYPLLSRITGKKLNPYIAKHDGVQVIAVEKISGCCMMLKSTCVEQCGFLDENVFLYCEEPILAKRIRQAGGTILFTPEVCVNHNHPARKASPQGMRLFFRSRAYYVREYSDYNSLQKAFLTHIYENLEKRCARKIHSAKV